MKERKVLEEQISDLQHENDVLKDRIVKIEELGNEEDLLDIPLMRNEEENKYDQRAGCLWRLSSYFNRKK